jgi:hypothetical protein
MSVLSENNISPIESARRRDGFRRWLRFVVFLRGLGGKAIKIPVARRSSVP